MTLRSKTFLRLTAVEPSLFLDSGVNLVSTTSIAINKGPSIPTFQVSPSSSIIHSYISSHPIILASTFLNSLFPYSLCAQYGIFVSPLRLFCFSLPRLLPRNKENLFKRRLQCFFLPVGLPINIFKT